MRHLRRAADVIEDLPGMPNTTKSTEPLPAKLFHRTPRGRILLGDSLEIFRKELERHALLC
jgi:hypothetical protein